MLGWFRKKKKSPVPDGPDDGPTRQLPVDEAEEEPEEAEPAAPEPAAPPTEPARCCRLPGRP